MPDAAALRIRLESALAHRIPSALTPAPPRFRPVLPAGIAAIDELLQGGFPVGAISEIAGPECSGRTSLALSFLAGLTAQGKVCAWVDVSDTLCPASAASSGVDLMRLLWVRCGDGSARPPAGPAVPASQLRQNTPAPPRDASPARSTQGCGSPHPRSEVRGLDTAVQDLMRRKDSFVRDKSIGTPPFVICRSPGRTRLPTRCTRAPLPCLPLGNRNVSSRLPRTGCPRDAVIRCFCRHIDPPPVPKRNPHLSQEDQQRRKRSMQPIEPRPWHKCNGGPPSWPGPNPGRDWTRHFA